jgi:hypothetical protein
MSGAAGSSRAFSSGLALGPQVTVVPPRPMAAQVSRTRLLYTSLIYVVNIDIPVSVAVSVTFSVLYKLTIAVAVAVAVGLQRLIKLSLNVPVTVTVALIRLIALTFGIDVTVAVNSVERLIISVIIEATSTIIAAIDAVALFFTGTPGSKKPKWKKR